MKTTLSIKESANLIELGVDANKASEIEYRPKKCGYGRIGYRVYSLADLLSILPKRIDTDEDVHPIVMSMDDEADVWYAAFMGFSKTQFAPELIDALNSLLIWCLTEKKINFNTEKK